MRVRTETRSRALALRLLYAWDAAGCPPERGLREASWARILACVSSGPLVDERALALASGACARIAELDAHVARAAANWRLDRLGLIDRNLLRLAITELLDPAVPPKVAIDEAVRLAHWFGGPRTPAFVNGVLDRVARELGRL